MRRKEKEMRNNKNVQILCNYKYLWKKGEKGVK